MKLTTFSLLGLTCDLPAERAFFARGLRILAEFQIIKLDKDLQQKM